VYWSVPKTWYPGGVVFTSEQIMQLFRLLSRMPASGARDLLLRNVLKCLPQPSPSAAWVTSEMTAREERQLPTIEDAANQKIALHFSYFSVHRGNEAVRSASVHRVLPGPPARFLATCHRSGKLKWFRVQNVSECRLQRSEPFRDLDDERIEAHLRASLNGFHADAQPAKHSFFVREADARWVERNLIAGMRAHEAPGGIRIDVETAALERLARFVVGLGAAARPLTAELEAAVTELARGALDASSPGRTFSRD
jgi:predicted DNA-binding transcriptional regulator YafY